jgi:putative ATP-dependent endonuclease of the OLD family
MFGGVSLKVKYHKCFSGSEQGFAKIMPINILIGKNNSGKSSLIDLIEYAIKGDPAILKVNETAEKAQVIVTQPLVELDIKHAFPKDTAGGGIPTSNHWEYGKHWVGTDISYFLEGKNKTLKSFARPFEFGKSESTRIINRVNCQFHTLNFRCLTAERDIVPEDHAQDFILHKNGSGATTIVQRVINHSIYSSDLIEKRLLEELNKITEPDIKFKDIVVQLLPSNLWEIYLEDENKGRIPLSKMGSGIKTILLALLNTLVLPELEKKSPKSYIFAFEELENNLHPALQRRLFEYLRKFALINNTTLFITTHSHVVIDLFNSDKNSQIIHVTSNGKYSEVKNISTHLDKITILDDLDIKASDILQSNGIIWVEGPSDRIYLNHWISIVAPNFQEGLHYSIMFYGGKLLRHLHFNSEFFDNELIPLLRLNKNAVILIDRDGNTINAKLNATKIRIQKELGETGCWITKGREIENYIPENSIKAWIETKTGIDTQFKYSSNQKLEENILTNHKKLKIDYSRQKTFYAKEIIQFIKQEDINVLDLNKQMSIVSSLIKKWNNR